MAARRSASTTRRRGTPAWSAKTLLIGGVVALAGITCSIRAPRNIDDTCAIFEARRGWYRSARKASVRWGVPIHVQLALIHQESRFRGNAKPPRRRILWVIPGPRVSSAAGYTQALESTWREYIEDSGNRGADRDDFADAVDFIGWYADRTARSTGIAKHDAFNLYLAYHEGNAGFRRGTYRRKPWLMKVAAKVQERAGRYQSQLLACEERLKPRWWQFWLS